jgi:hypothetical protein
MEASVPEQKRQPPDVLAPIAVFEAWAWPTSHYELTLII